MRTLAERYWWFVLAIPFLVAIALLAGMTRTMPVFHGGDEPFHYAVILEFAQKPFMDVVRDYATTNGPFYYLLFGAAGRVIGLDLWKMRLLNVLVSYAALVIAYLLFHRRLKMHPTRALAAVVVLGLSPYFFSSALIILTDNLTWLFLFGALYLWLEYEESGSAVSAAMGCIAMALACFTRQSAVWVVFPALVAIARSRATVRSRILSCMGVALSLAPLVFLVATWGGLVPPSSKLEFSSAGLFNPRVALFILALLGLYALFIVPSERINVLRQRRSALKWLLGALGASIMANAIRPLHREMTASIVSDGYLWRLSALGQRGDTSPVMWILIPVGALATACLALTATRREVLFWGGSLVAFVLVSGTSAQVYQKYYDVFLLLFLFALSYKRPPEESGEFSVIDGSRLLVLGLLFASYPIVRMALGF